MNVMIFPQYCIQFKQRLINAFKLIVLFVNFSKPSVINVSHLRQMSSLFIVIAVIVIVAAVVVEIHYIIDLQIDVIKVTAFVLFVAVALNVNPLL